jgi:hypothetical protein
MFGDGALTFQEFAMREPHPLAVIHDAVLEFLRGRDDAVLYGAQAVNAYVKEPRMTQDVDIAATAPEEFAAGLCKFLNKKFHIAVKTREVRDGLGYRIYQVQKPKNRHLVDIRPVKDLPPANRVKKILVVTPAELIANKPTSMCQRKHKPKGLIDQADLFRLLLAFPELKSVEGPVADRLRAGQASAEMLATWKEIVGQEILPEDEDDKFVR